MQQVEARGPSAVEEKQCPGHHLLAARAAVLTVGTGFSDDRPAVKACFLKGTLCSWQKEFLLCGPKEGERCLGSPERAPLWN